MRTIIYALSSELSEAHEPIIFSSLDSFDEFYFSKRFSSTSASKSEEDDSFIIWSKSSFVSHLSKIIFKDNYRKILNGFQYFLFWYIII